MKPFDPYRGTHKKVRRRNSLSAVSHRSRNTPPHDGKQTEVLTAKAIKERPPEKELGHTKQSLLLFLGSLTIIITVQT